MRIRPAAAALLLALCACSSPYMKNRGRDALDVFTVEFETRSYGASVRTGPLKAGLNYRSGSGFSAGLRGGDAGTHSAEELTIFFAGRDRFHKNEPPAAPAGTEQSPADGESESPESKSEEGAEENTDPAILSRRDKEFAAFSPFGTTLPAYKKRSLFKQKGGFAPAYYYTQIEVSVGLFAGLRVGFNPGELVDLLAGIFTFDPFSDDEPFPTAEERALEENPVYRSLNEEQKRRFREEFLKRGGL